MEEYRFQTTEGSGLVRLAASEVEVDMRRGFSQWNYTIPYTELRPYPMHYRTTESSVWLCLAIGFGGICAAISYFFELEKRAIPIWMYPFLFLAGLGLIAYAYLHRRHHWVTFASGRSFNLSFAREGRDAARFEQFVSNLTQRILTSQSSCT